MIDKSTHTKSTRSDKRWDMLVLDEYGKIIPIRRFKGLAIGMAVGLALALVGIAVVSWLYIKSQNTHSTLQSQVNAANEKIAELRHEKDILLAKLVVAQTEAERKPKPKPASAASQKAPEDRRTVPAKTKTRPAAVARPKTAPASASATPAAKAKDTPKPPPKKAKTEPAKREAKPAQKDAAPPVTAKRAPSPTQPAKTGMQATDVAQVAKPSPAALEKPPVKTPSTASPAQTTSPKPAGVADLPGAELELQPPAEAQDSPQTETPASIAGADTVATTTAAVKTPVEKPVQVDVEIVSVLHDPGQSELKVRYKIKKILPPRGPVKGRTVFVLKADPTDQGTWVTSPRVPLVDGRPTGERGQRFSIVRFRVAEIKLEGQPTPQLFKVATVYVYTMTGELLLEKNFDITVGSI